MEKEFGVCRGGTPCLRVILNALPVVDDSTPLDEILAFRKDPEAIRLRGQLMTWQNQVEGAHLSTGEIAELLAARLGELRAYMQNCGLRVRLKKTELVIRFGAAIVESIAKQSLDPVLQRIFEFKQVNLDLRDAELIAPGREVAYITYATAKFGAR